MSCHFHMVRKRMLAEKRAAAEKSSVVHTAVDSVENPVEKAAKPSKRGVKRGK